MGYTENTKPGMGDPYWYEWTVGLEYIVDMLNPDNRIKYVELQADVSLGLDDVVITYDDDSVRFIQVKHTRAEDTLNFGDLVSTHNKEDCPAKGYSLLWELANSWNKERDKYSKSEVYIFTNRTVGKRVSRAGKDNEILRPRLSSFWPELRRMVEKVDSFSEIKFPGYEEAWKEWCGQLNCIESDEDKLMFLKHLHIQYNQNDLRELGKSVKTKLQHFFHINENSAEMLLMRLDHALRNWTCSIRYSSKITIEALYDALSIQGVVERFNHDLIPTTPFFESRQLLVDSLEAELCNSKEKVLFLSGVPGTGKTNIISKLCNKKDTVIIDIRYYAYEPIDPTREYLTTDVSERVRKEVFWDTLLNQLRELLKGKLFKYNVPVVNSFLTVEKKKNEFLRIASAYAKDESRNFVVAVDGIDHAARAGILEETFLYTLPHPDYIPNNVKFLIAGQPKEKYTNYPLWLYENLDSVKEFEVPNIQPEDIEVLVDDKCSSYSKKDRLLITNMVCRYSGGNTLAAIFAVQEALLCDDLSLFEERLKQRKLSGNIQEYYRTIWNDAQRHMEVPFVDYKVAGVFAFFNEPISAEKLYYMFKSEPISISMWSNILKALSPLLIEKDGNYTILHNDVRVFLSGIIGIDQEHVREVYSGLVDYYLMLKEKTEGYYHDIIRFLMSARRIDEFTNVYTPSYVINAYVTGVDLSELRGVADELIVHVSGKSILDWKKIRCLTFGYLTMDQIEKSSYEIEDASFRTNHRSISIHPYECYVVPTKKWNDDIITEVLRLAVNLFESGETTRGKVLFFNWFSDTRLNAFIAALGTENDDHFNNCRDIPELVAKACVYSDNYDLLHGVDKVPDDDWEIVSKIIEKTEEEILLSLNGDKLFNALADLEELYIDPLIVGIKRKIELDQYDDLKKIKNVLQSSDFHNANSKMIFAFLEILIGETDWIEAKSNCDRWSEIENAKMPDEYIENLMSYYSVYALVAAYLRDEDRATIANDVTEKYISAHKHKKRDYYLLYFNAVCLLGKWLKSRNTNVAFFESVTSLGQIIDSLFLKKWNSSDIDFEISFLKAYVLKGYIILLRKENQHYQEVINPIIERVFHSNPVNQMMDPGMMFYRDNPTRIQRWVDEWLDVNGKVWAMEIGERNRIVKKFYEIVNHYDDNACISLRGAIEKIQWSVIGFVSHKEYTVEILRNWYNNLVKKDSKYILQYGGLVKDISDLIAEVGDNRLDYLIDSKIYSDWGSQGTIVIQDILKKKRYFHQCILQPSLFVEMLIGYLEKNTLTKEELLLVWAMGIGLLDWRNEDDHGSIVALEKAIILCSERNGISNIDFDLKRLGAAYVGLSVDSVRYVVPNRWIDKTQDLILEKDPLDIIYSYLNEPERKIQNSEVISALDVLHKSGKLEDEIVIELLSHELDKGDYWIDRNPICEVLVGIGNEKIVDEAIRLYIQKAVTAKSFYPAQLLPAVIGWRMNKEDGESAKESVDLMIEMFKCWLTVDGHMNLPVFAESYDYYKCIELEGESIFDFYFEILQLIIKSDDADAARVALGGIAAVIRTNVYYAYKLEKNWSNIHYRAKEWILMIYELVYCISPDSRALIGQLLMKHANDEDFNVALYSIMLCEEFDLKFDFPSLDNKSFLSDIPKNGLKLLLKTPRRNPWINGYESVLLRKELLEKQLNIDLSDIEKRTAEYSDTIDWDANLIPINRRKPGGGCRVVCDKDNLSFFRILYKDWLEKRWEGFETDLARVILSASEPYALLVTPNAWKWNNCRFFEKLNDILDEEETLRNKKVQNLFCSGIHDDEIVLAAAMEDYTYNKRLYGYMLAYFEVYDEQKDEALYIYERNARVILKHRADYFEKRHMNISLHQNGIESFKQSSIMCGLSKYVLFRFGWKESVQTEGVKLVNKDNDIVGRLECYYAFRTDYGHQSVANQPILQRWVVSEKALERAIIESKCPDKIMISTESIITDANC